MPPSISCPDSAQLRKLVDGSATPEEQAALAQHLTGCPNCQMALERLSSTRDSWADMAQQLADRPVAEPALANAIHRLEADAGRMETAEHQPVDAANLDFLDPPEKPGQLGKLAHYEVVELIGRGGM